MVHISNTATDAGLIFLDSVDFYINFGLILMGFFETFGAGWIFGIEKQIASLGASAVFAYMFINFASVIAAAAVWFGADDNAVWGGFVTLFLVYFVGMIVVLVLLQQRMAQEPGKWTWSSILYEISMSNVLDLRYTLSTSVGYMPWLWAFMIKQITPHILLLVFINLAQSDNADDESLFGHYENYVNWPYQILGMLIVAWAFSIVLIGMAFPNVFECADLTVNYTPPSQKSAADGNDNSSDGMGEAVQA
jgi:hypothetical protein